MKLITKKCVLLIALVLPLASCHHRQQPSLPKTNLKTVVETKNSIEDFCKDNFETVERYKEYLKPDYHWHQDPKIEARQKRNIRRFVEQYERLCSK